jgi:hypothetical protein
MAALLALLLCCGMAGAAPLSTAPIKWRDPDDQDIPPPAEILENQVWDIADHTFFYQVGKALDLGWSARRLGNLLHLAPPRQADNLNELDEVPNSSWYTNRHFLHPMSLEELAAGPGEAAPDTSGPWEIVAGKFEGGTAGFTIRDARGARFLLKFDSPGNREMGSAAEVIATAILHAAGYHVPRNSVVYFEPERFQIGARATVPAPGGGKRPMTPADLREILGRIDPGPDGRLRCVASRFLEGRPAGVFDYHGRRRDDANDRVDHEHRRELRGLRVIGSWMNDADRRAANTLDMYVEQEGRRFLKHYLIDMGSTFGSNNLMPHPPKYGNEYVWDPRTILRSLVSMGFYRKPWEEPLPMPYPSLGYFENQTFDPGRWVPTYPNPAFERCTNRDGYWGAKIVMSFTDEEIRAMVDQGRYSDPGASAELARLLAERRDLIGRYWFGKVNPLDRFAFEEGALVFVDLAVAGKLEEEGEYQCRLLDSKGRPAGSPRVLAEARVEIEPDLESGRYHGYELRTRRPGQEGWSRYTRVYFYKWPEGRLQLVRVEREE